MVEAQVEFRFTASELDELKSELNLLDRIVKHLGKSVVRDNVVKKICVLTGVSSYSEDPLNLFLRGPSSIGKTHNVREALKYMPQEDILYLGGLSPTALIHEHGVLVDENGEPIDLSEKPKKSDFKGKDGKIDVQAYRTALKLWEEKLRNSYYLIELHNKILVFLEAPHIETYNMLRPLLSHDKWEISYKFTDKTGKGSLRTTHVVLRGWPACFFCSTDVKYVEDLATRGFSVTPEMTTEKYKEAIKLKAKLDSSPFHWIREDEELHKLRAYMAVLSGRAKITKGKAVMKVIIPYAENLADVYPAHYSRDMRDYNRLLSLIKANAILNFFNRPILCVEREGERREFLIATPLDLKVALEIFSGLEETTRTGVPGHILWFFHNVVEKLYRERGPVRYNDLMEEYNRIAERTVSSRTIRRWCDVLSEIGWIDKQPDPDDKRHYLISVVRKGNIDNSGLSQFNSFFDLESFKEWFIEQKKYGHKNGWIIYLKVGDVKIHDLNDNVAETELRPYFIFEKTDVKEERKPKKVESTTRPQFSIIQKKLVEGRGCYDCVHFKPSEEPGYYAGFCNYLQGYLTDPTIMSVLKTGCEGFKFKGAKHDMTEKTLEAEKSGISRFDLNSVLGWSYLIQPVTGVCAGCGLKNATLTRSVSLRDGRKLYVCEDCGREVHAWLRMKEQE